ncbi:hypothetical protein V3C99_015721, partial [Haemonchus contortus]
MDLERLYREDHTFFKVIVGDFNAKIGPRRTAEELHIGTHGVEWNEQGERLQDEYIAPSVLPSEIRHAIIWLGSSHGTCRNAKCPRRGKLARLCCCTKREIQTILAIIAQSAC